MKRIAVLGTTGAGKSVLARRLSDLIGSPHVEFDQYRIGPNWTMAPDEVYRGRLAEALGGDCWVADGNAPVARDIVWPAATTLVWLDYSVAVVLWRLFRRTMRRVVTRQRLWNGNRESVRSQLFTRDSMLVHALRTHWKYRRAMVADVRRPEYSHLSTVRLRSPGETERWLRSVAR